MAREPKRSDDEPRRRDDESRRRDDGASKRRDDEATRRTDESKSRDDESRRDDTDSRSWLRLAQSYLGKRVVESRSSEHNPLLEVVYDRGRCVLNSRSVNYSFGSLHRVFEEAFAKLHLEQRTLREVLLLGCGAGSVVEILRKQYSKECAITAVEIDPVVIELARRHFMIDRVPNLEIVCADAREYVATARKKFDLVVIDLFIDDRVPPAFRSREFLERVRKLLAKGGLVVFNAIDDSPDTKLEADELKSSFAVTFPSYGCLDLSGNRVYFAEAE